MPMVAKELYSDYLEGGNGENTLLQQDPYDDELEEALSLCDLPISSDYFSKEDGKNSEYSNNNKIDDELSVDDDNLFEFFSEEFTTTTASTCATNSENIIFCGKLIPFKDHQHKKIIPQKIERNKSATKRSNYQKKSFAGDYTSMGKVSLVRSATKSRWFLFMFGMSRLSSNEMQLSDIRNRQSRKESPVRMFPARENGREAVKTTEGRSKKNLNGKWRIFRSISLILGCSSSKITNDVVKAAFV